MSPILIAIVYAVVAIAVLPGVLSLFKAKYDWIDVILASVGAALIFLVPTIGSFLWFPAMIGILYLRLKEDLGAICIAAMATGAAAFAVLLPLRLS